MDEKYINEQLTKSKWSDPPTSLLCGQQSLADQEEERESLRDMLYKETPSWRQIKDKAGVPPAPQKLKRNPKESEDIIAAAMNLMDLACDKERECRELRRKLWYYE